MCVSACVRACVYVCVWKVYVAVNDVLKCVPVLLYVFNCYMKGYFLYITVFTFNRRGIDKRQGE